MDFGVASRMYSEDVAPPGGHCNWVGGVPQNRFLLFKKSPTGPTERTPNKPEYLIARLQLTERGPLVRSHVIFDGF